MFAQGAHMDFQSSGNFSNVLTCLARQEKSGLSLVGRLALKMVQMLGLRINIAAVSRMSQPSFVFRGVYQYMELGFRR